MGEFGRYCTGLIPKESLMTDILKTRVVQDLLDRASGVSESGGNPRLKAIMRDLLGGPHGPDRKT